MRKNEQARKIGKRVRECEGASGLLFCWKRRLAYVAIGYRLFEQKEKGDSVSTGGCDVLSDIGEFDRESGERKSKKKRERKRERENMKAPATSLLVIQ